MLEDKEKTKGLLGELGLEKKLEKQKPKPELERILIGEPNENYRKAAAEYFQSIGVEVDFAEKKEDIWRKIKMTEYDGVILVGDFAWIKVNEYLGCWVERGLRLPGTPTIYIDVGIEKDEKNSLYYQTYSHWEGRYGFAQLKVLKGKKKNETGFWQEVYQALIEEKKNVRR